MRRRITSLGSGGFRRPWGFGVTVHWSSQAAIRSLTTCDGRSVHEHHREQQVLLHPSTGPTGGALEAVDEPHEICRRPPAPHFIESIDSFVGSRARMTLRVQGNTLRRPAQAAV